MALATAFSTHASTLTTLLAFPPNKDGANPGSLVQIGQYFYGTTDGGGAFSSGTLFRLDPATHETKTLHEFEGRFVNPVGIISYGGAIYGVAGYSQTAIFKFDPVSNKFSVIYQANPSQGGAYFAPSSLLASGGALYGVTIYGGDYNEGTVFKLDLMTDAETTLYTFKGGSDGAFPDGNLVMVGDLLYGATSEGGIGQYGNGTIYSLNVATKAERILYAFPNSSSSDPASPKWGVTAIGDTLYGTTYGGGSAQYPAGVLFSINRLTGAESTLYNFSSDIASGGLLASNGILYGGAMNANDGGYVFSFDPSSGTEKTLYNLGTGTQGAASGFNPTVGLLVVDGTLYGTTYGGGVTGVGEVFSLDLATNVASDLHDFTGFGQGFSRYPAVSGLLALGGQLYGTTSWNGSANLGMLYRFNPATVKSEMLHSFIGGDDGLNPIDTLVHVGSVVYGTTPGDYNFPYPRSQPDTNLGTVFKYDVSTRSFSTVYNFQPGSELGFPNGSLSYADGMLYGAALPNCTMVLCTDDGGAVFSLDPVTGTEATVHGFPSSPPNEGTFPHSGPIKLGKNLYGITLAGGIRDNGVIYQINAATHAESVFVRIPFNSGSVGSSLLRVGNVIYGGTDYDFRNNGSGGPGGIYSIQPGTRALTMLATFSGSTGYYVFGSLINVGGILYGTTKNGGASDHGTIFSFDPTTKVISPLYSFTGGADGGFPFSSLTYLNGAFYGIASGGVYPPTIKLYRFVP